MFDLKASIYLKITGTNKNSADAHTNITSSIETTPIH